MTNFGNAWGEQAGHDEFWHGGSINAGDTPTPTLPARGGRKGGGRTARPGMTSFGTPHLFTHRHGRACPGHDVLKFPGKDVDARHNAGHDELRGEGEQRAGHDEHGRVDHISLFGHLAA